MTDGFTFFPNYAEAAKGLSDKQRLEFYDSIINLAIYGEDTEPSDRVVLAMYTLIKPTLNKSVTRMTAGKIGGSKKGDTEKAKKEKVEKQIDNVIKGTDEAKKLEDENQENFACEAKNNLLDKQNEICLASKNEFASEAKEKNKNKNKNKNMYISLSPTSPSESKISEAPQAKNEREREESDFDLVWDAYPRKESKSNAISEWVKAVEAGDINFGDGEKIVQAIERMKSSRQWQQENGRFIPMLAKYISERRWNDEPTDVSESNTGSFDTDEFFDLAKKRSFEKFGVGAEA